MSKEVFISSSLSGKITITFYNIWDIFTRKQGGVIQVKGVESKFQKYYFIHTIPG